MSTRKVLGVGIRNVLPKRFVTVWCSTAVTKGEVISLDLALDVTETRTNIAEPDGDLTVKKCVADNDPLACGIAAETITVAGPLRVQFSGFVEGTDGPTCEVAAAITKGTPVGTDATAPGRIQAFTGNITATAQPFALCVNNYSAYTVAGTGQDGGIIIEDRGWFSDF